MKASVIQMVSTLNIDENLDQAEALLRTAQSEGAKLAVLPEMFAHFGEKDALKFAHEWTGAEGPIRQKLRQLADELNLTIVAGTLPITDNEIQQKPTASSIVINDEGIEYARYDKIHLFDVDIADQQGSYRESDFYEPGGRTCVTNSPLGSLGVAICYDLRFPELFRNLTQRGAEIVAIPSAFTYQTGSAHWMPLLQARAIENQCFILAANQGGQHSPKRKTWGHSCIIDPWGNILGLLQEGPGVITNEINLEEAVSIRKNIPCLQHRMNWL